MSDYPYETIEIDDLVLWRGGFGQDAPRIARVTSINQGKEGPATRSVRWARFIGRNYAVSLDNGHWAYANR